MPTRMLLDALRHAWRVNDRSDSFKNGAGMLMSVVHDSIEKTCDKSSIGR